MKKIFFLFAFASFVQAQSIAEDTFEKFLNKAIPVEDQVAFRSFYNKLLYVQQKEKQSTKLKNRNKQRSYMQQLKTLGRDAVEIRDSNLAKNIKFQEKCIGQQKNIATFYYRYGAYEEFLKQRAFKNHSIIVKAKTYVRDMKNKMLTWFGLPGEKYASNI